MGILPPDARKRSPDSWLVTGLSSGRVRVSCTYGCASRGRRDGAGRRGQLRRVVLRTRAAALVPYRTGLAGALMPGGTAAALGSGALAWGLCGLVLVCNQQAGCSRGWSGASASARSWRLPWPRRRAAAGGRCCCWVRRAWESLLADWVVGSAAADGLRTVRGWCSAAGMPPLWVWERVLESMGLTLPWQDWRAGSARPDRELVAAAVVESLAGAARPGPLLVVPEDVHWCDPASVLVARAVADAAAALPLALLMTCRDDQQEMAPQVRDQLADLPTAVRRMSLPPLGVPDVADLAALSLGHELPEDGARELHGRAGGNPFFVHELTRLMAAHGPASAQVVPVGIREVLERRIARLSQPCARLLTAASVAAQTAADLIETDLACEVCDLDPADAVPLLDEAVAARLVDFDPDAVVRYLFRHALVREVMEQGLPGSERGRLHTRVAEALGSGKAGPLAPRLAYHWSRATATEAPERAAAWSLRAACEAMAGFGFEAAAAHYARAVAGPSTDRITVSVEYGEALQLCGDVDAARGVLLAAAAEAAAAGRAADLANAALALGGGLAGFEVPIRDDDQSDLLRQADAILPPGESALRAAVRGRLSLALAGSVPDAERVELAQDAVRMARSAREARIESAVLAAYCDAIPGPDYVAERAVAAGRMVSLAGNEPGASLRQPASLLLARRLLVVAHLERGDLAGR